VKDIIIREATEADACFAKLISQEMESSAIARGSGISKRSAASLISKMKEGNAVIAVTPNNEWIGFSYIQVWANGEFVSNSGLIVSPAYRGKGVARLIKKKVFQLSREKYPAAKVFSITTGLAIMKLNARLGFGTVTFNEIPSDKKFWAGCKSCINYGILQSKGRKNCLCTAMLYIPSAKQKIKRAVA